MPSQLRRAAIALCLLSSSLLPIAGCVGTRLSPPILATLNCVKRIPAKYRQPIPAPGFLEPNETDAQLAILYDGSVTALDQANGRVDDLIGMAEACQEFQQAVLTTLNPPPWWSHFKIHVGKKTP